MKNNEEKYSKLRLDKYQISKEDDYIKYVCIDQNGNYYIFTQNEDDLVGYNIILDTYTIDLPEFIEKYNSVEENEKVLLNIQKIFLAINSGDYNYVYNKLDNTFKSNNFPTLSQFEEYAKQNFYANNKVSYGKYQKNGEVYVYNIQISDADNLQQAIIRKTFVMQLKEGTDFVMSFSVE